MYFSEEDEDIHKWAKDNQEVFGGFSNMTVKALEILKKEKGDAIDQLSDDDGPDMFT